MKRTQQDPNSQVILPGSTGALTSFPTIMTEDELIRFLRIPEISNAANHRHVIENLKRKHGLPRIHLCGKTVYLTDSVKQWLQRARHLWQLKARSGTMGLDQPKPSASIGKEVQYERAGKA